MDKRPVRENETATSSGAIRYRVIDTLRPPRHPHHVVSRVGASSYLQIQPNVIILCRADPKTEPGLGRSGSKQYSKLKIIRTLLKRHDAS